MNKRDVMELRRRFKKDNCTISRLAGCYVDAYKNKLLTFNENFLNLPEDEFYKYMDLAKKTLAGTIGNNLLELEFPGEEEEPGGRQQFYMGLKSSDLKNEDLLERLYDLVIENYTHTGNYLILVFKDTYDIMSRTSDNMKLDESEEVYEYILVSICPVDLSKPGLGYREDENRIGSRIRDWIVGAPETGFLFPAFNDRGADIHRVDYYIRDAKDSHPEFIEEVLGCGVRRTATELKQTFQAIVRSAYGQDEDKARVVLSDISESIGNRVEELRADADMGVTSGAPIVLDDRVISEILDENDVKGAPAQTIRDICHDEFADETPLLETLVNEKELEKGRQEKRERELVKENARLKEILSVTNADGGVIVKVDPSVEGRISSRIIDDQKFVLIPVDDDETLVINGHETVI
ncbi:MAG: DUF4317 domain-containing protein [Lachnospiraceae bacterium]|nr:DUF4317 domain-containing protein [Lachnospiraceae bacterium]